VESPAFRAMVHRYNVLRCRERARGTQPVVTVE
jgi:hypothetical protein